MEAVSRTFFGALFAPLRRSDERGALMRELFAVNDDPPTISPGSPFPRRRRPSASRGSRRLVELAASDPAGLAAASWSG
jgi:hypothetical protein